MDTNKLLSSDLCDQVEVARIKLEDDRIAYHQAKDNFEVSKKHFEEISLFLESIQQVGEITVSVGVCNSVYNINNRSYMIYAMTEADALEGYVYTCLIIEISTLAPIHFTSFHDTIEISNQDIMDRVIKSYIRKVFSL